jgi:UTP--glucose-1-phosphate uridylyltransferase
MTITKAVIPAAGFGTRMLPAAKAVPKELLPILDKPTIQYVVEEAAAGGVTDVQLISSPAKRAVEQHFQSIPDLENRLKSSGKSALLVSIADLMAKVTVSAVDQPEQRGLGDAVRHARAFTANEPFLCLLGDTIFAGDPQPAQQLVDAYQRLGTSVIGVEQVATDKVERYGIVAGQQIDATTWKLDTMIEKPPAASAPSRLAIAARYILTPAIFDCIDATPPGKGGEIQLTDAMRLLMKREPVHAILLRATRHDIGNPIDWLKTNLIFAARDKSLWEKIAPLARSLLNDHGDDDGDRHPPSR